MNAGQNDQANEKGETGTNLCHFQDYFFAGTSCVWGHQFGRAIFIEK